MLVDGTPHLRNKSTLSKRRRLKTPGLGMD